MALEGSGFNGWEDSCLIKFSEFLGFPIVGYEDEILDLMHKLVASQKQVKGNGSLAVTKSERELKKLECCINYNGQSNTKGRRDRGDFLLKFK